MNAVVLSLDGNEIENISLPDVFLESIRPDFINRAFLAYMACNRQAYGSNIMAGKRTSAHYHGRRRVPHSMMCKSMARMARLHSTSPSLSFRARFVPQAVKGRKAHPPKAEKVWDQKINKKERRKVIRSCIAATSNKEVILKRGHLFDLKVPIIIEDKFEDIKKTKDLFNVLNNIGLENELKRTKKKKIRAGKGKMRGRKYKRKKSVLIVTSKKSDVEMAARNIPGIDIVEAKNLGIDTLAPGGVPGRLTIYSKSAIQKL